MNNTLNILLFTLLLSAFDGYGQGNTRIHNISIDSTLLIEADFVADVYINYAYGAYTQEGGSNWTPFKFETVNLIKKISSKRGLDSISRFSPPAIFNALHGDDSLYRITYFDSQSLKKKLFVRKCCDTLLLDHYYRIYLKFGRTHTPGEFVFSGNNNWIEPQKLILLKAVPMATSFFGHIKKVKEEKAVKKDTIIDLFQWVKSGVKKDSASAMCQMLVINDTQSIKNKIEHSINEINMIGGTDRLLLLTNWLHAQPCVVALKSEVILTSFPAQTGITIRSKTDNGNYIFRLSIRLGKREKIGKKKFTEDYDYLKLESIIEIKNEE
ncbi:MAG: hypothetical protein ACI9J3_002515 [Parvicellaceae bacterium]|jgi:hypothetical protein